MSLSVYLHSNCCKTCHRYDIAYEANITHNLAEMAEAAGIYNVVWHPEDIGITQARKLVKPLRRALKLMKAYPGKFKQFDSKNGWGTYEDFVPWLERYLEACLASPDAEVHVSR